MKATTFILLIILFGACGHSALKMENVQNIRITAHRPAGPVENAVVITDKAQIREITSILETAEREPVKVMSTYKMEVQFKDSTTTLFVMNDIVRQHGLTYRLKNDLGGKLAAILETSH